MTIADFRLLGWLWTGRRIAETVWEWSRWKRKGFRAERAFLGQLFHRVRLARLVALVRVAFMVYRGERSCGS
jgi:hypothetical protein